VNVKYVVVPAWVGRHLDRRPAEGLADVAGRRADPRAVKEAVFLKIRADLYGDRFLNPKIGRRLPDRPFWYNGG
jgi:hypothetical protein